MHTNLEPKAEVGHGRSFRVKFFLVAAGSVLLALALSGLFAVHNFNRLGQDASAKIEEGLTQASHEYLSNYIRTIGERSRLILDQAFSEVQMLADVMQSLIDHPRDTRLLGDTLSGAPGFQNRLVPEVRSNQLLYAQNQPPARSVISVWQPMLENDGSVKPDVLDAIEDTAVLDLLLPTMAENGAGKLYMYMVGPHGRSFLRLSHYVNMAAEFDKNYPGSTTQDFWDFFFPGMVDCWNALPGQVDSNVLRRTVTTTPPYEDAAGGGIIVSVFHPVWQVQEGKTVFAGAAAMDFSLTDIVDLIRDVKLAKSGFAFITQPNGNVLAINEQGGQALGLKTLTSATGVNVQMRELGASAQPSVRNLALPQDDQVHLGRLMLVDHEGNEVPHLLTLLRLPPVSKRAYTKGQPARLTDEHWTLGFVVPEREIFESLAAAQQEISGTLEGILRSYGVVGLVSLLAAIVSAMLLGRRMTQGLSDLANAARRLQQKDYGVRVDVRSQDEVGQLASVFNGMAGEIQEYTTNLEGLVRQRTSELEEANVKVHLLNKRLQEDNLRMGAELDVARQLQLMVLPKQEELDAVDPQLDISGYMRPADEVGGDYYDVLRHRNLVKIGMGDVTGHGLESGVLMLMVQSIVRSLLAMDAYDPVRFLNVLNQVLFQNIERANIDKSLTLCFLDFQGDELTLSGQHEELIVARASGRIERINTMDLGLPIGLVPDTSPYVAAQRVPFGKTDVLLLFTDGITEAENAAGEQFGIERLCASLQQHRTLDAKQIQQAITADVLAFIGKHTVFDDLTLLVVKRVG